MCAQEVHKGMTLVQIPLSKTTGARRKSFFLTCLSGRQQQERAASRARLLERVSVTPRRCNILRPQFNKRAACGSTVHIHRQLHLALTLPTNARQRNDFNITSMQIPAAIKN